MNTAKKRNLFLNEVYTTNLFSCHYECSQRLRQHQKAITHIYHTWWPKKSDKFTCLYSSELLPFKLPLSPPTTDIQVIPWLLWSQLKACHLSPSHVHAQPSPVMHLPNFKLLPELLRNYLPVFIFVFPNLDAPYRGDHLPLGMQKL